LDLTVPQIVKKWNESILLVKSIDKNGNILGQGSGFVISENGVIATNYHVVKSSHSVLIQFVNGKSYQEVSLIAGYPSNDLAILYIEKDDSFLPVILGDSDNLQTGEQILAIGNPYGFENTISDGLISGIRKIGDFKLLQITAPVSPGSSGGALFNMKGEVIGITSIGSQWDAQNLNFAIPTNILKFLVREKL
jgi:S1-C subfamily serine protease